MATSPLNDPIRHLTAMMARQVGHSQALARHVDQLVTAVSDLSKDMRAGFRNANERVDLLREEMTERLKILRQEMNERFDRLREEMNERFRAVGVRFDEMEERMIRVEDGLRDIRSDLLRMENELLNA